MKTQEFINALKAAYLKQFPYSTIAVNLSHNLYSNITITLKLAGNQSEVAYGIWENDMFNFRFMVSLDSGQLPKTLTLDSELPDNLMLTIDYSSYTTVPTEKYMASGHRKIPMRKTKGDAVKLLKYLEKNFATIKTSVQADMVSGMIHANHVNIVAAKVQLV